MPNPDLLVCGSCGLPVYRGSGHECEGSRRFDRLVGARGTCARCLKDGAKLSPTPCGTSRVCDACYVAEWGG
jgi:hypothetical protein